MSSSTIRRKPSVASLARSNIRSKKNKLIQDYFRFRIHSSPNSYNVLLRPTPYKVLFIVSHMRSGSSLLTHILSSNPEIIGYGETHTKYQSEVDLKNLMLNVYLKVPEFKTLSDIKNFRMDHSYILDKVLHNSRFSDYSFLASQNVYSIFLLREPKRSLGSLLDLKPHWTEQTAVDYYSDRLRQIETYAQFVNNPKHTLVVTYEQMLNQTQSVLVRLQQFLSTTQSFSEDYKVVKTTGQAGIGDHKGNIKAGRIIRNARALDITIGDEAVQLGQAAFDQCMTTLSKYCTII